MGSGLQTVGAAAGILSGLQRGGATGYAQAGLGTAGLANKAGAFGGSPNASLGSGLGIAGGAFGIYNGIKQGGVAGYGQAAAGGLQVGAGAANLAGDAGLASDLSTAAGAIGAPLAVYNAVENYQSGNAGADAMNDAEAGAAIGSFFGPIGTVIGAAGGAIVGGVSSLFGPGKTDQETSDVNQLINATGKNGNSSQIASSVQNPYLELAGLFDDKSSTLPMYQQYGRMGEQKFTDDMTTKINQAVQQDPGLKNNPQEVYQDVVAPWVQSMGKGYSNVGSTYTATTQGLLQDMVNQYMNGTAAQNWKAVGGDSPFSSIYNGSSFSAAPTAPVQSAYSGGQPSGLQAR